MNMRIDFWKAPHSWPRDTANFVFLARAIDLMGRGMFGEAWTGTETTVELYQTLPGAPLNGSSGRAYFAHSLLMKHRPDFGRQPLRRAGSTFGISFIPPMVSFSKEEWAAALALVRDNHDHNRPALTRLYQIKKRLVDLAESGKIVTALRPKAGGDQMLAPREWWNTEKTECRFDLCQMNPARPFDIGSAGDQYCWIYVTRESLETVLKSPKPAVEPALVTGDKPAGDGMSKLVAVKLATSDKRRLFQEWRDSCGERVPTIQEDVAQMKTLGINRDDARQLRKDHPSLPRGKPKAK